jgi:hypothetical protein
MSVGDEVLGKLSIERLLNKAATSEVIDTAQISNSILTRQQADRFIDLMVDVSQLLKQVRLAKIDHPSGEINKIDLGKTVTESTRAPGTSTFKPSASKVDYDTSKLRSAFDLTSDFLEDNIEGENVRDKLLNIFTKQIAIDMEMLGIQGSYTATPDGTALQRLLGDNNGYQALLQTAVPTPSQQIDAEGANASAALYYKMKSAIPARYRPALPNYRFVVSSRAWDKWAYDMTQVGAVSGGGTPNDTVARFREIGGGGKPFGIPQFEVPLFPTDLAYTVGGTPATDGSSIWLTPLKNLIYFIQRDITIEWDRVPRQDKWEVTIHTRCDFAVENADAVVIAKNVGVNGADYVID